MNASRTPGRRLWLPATLLLLCAAVLFLGRGAEGRAVASNVEPAHPAADACTQFTEPVATYLPLLLRQR